MGSGGFRCILGMILRFIPSKYNFEKNPRFLAILENGVNGK
jgi:hypothetical protein